MTTQLETLLARIDGLSADQRAELERTLDRAGTLSQFAHWRPQDGPQTEAYFSPADMMLYGGAAGGGKSDLICGLALFAHHRVGIYRQQAGELTGMIDRMKTILREAGMGRIVGNPPRWDGPDGQKIEFGHLERPGAEKSWQGRDHDLKAFDEAAQINPAKVLFVSGWNRSTRPGQRCRILLCSNPPLGGDGDYLMEWFGPWLDPLNPRYGTVKPGELLWAVFVGEGDEVRTVWLDGPEPVEIDGEMRTPKSRTFIPARMSDNKYLGEDYRATIDAMPEPIRTALLTGDFMVARKDHEWQVIPSAWVDLAFDRYDSGCGRGSPMTVIAADVAQGGPDRTVLAPLHGIRFEPNIVRRGIDTKDGADVGSLIIKERRNQALVVVDCTGGWGGDTVGFLSRQNGIRVERCIFSAHSGERARNSQLPFFNLRAQLYWRFAEALHPKSGEGLALPRSPAVRAQLTAHRWIMRSGQILIESKEDIRKRVGSSPDEADAVVMAWNWRQMAALNAVRRAGRMRMAKPQRDPFADL
ncbi:hypothetical protein [Breoghania sp. JC706]|uniref:hypothetical protein n=1 Tax=Breoghania sp. JC706 TaxID=3117732 RepID=UPI00300B6B7E